MIPQNAGEIRFTVEFFGPFHVAKGTAADGADRTVDRDVPLPASSIKGVIRAAATRLGLPDWLVGEVFGGARSSPWAWSDGDLTDPRSALTSRIRMAPEGVVAPGALLIGEHTWTDSGTFTVTLQTALPHDVRERHRLVLRAAAREVTALGGGRRRGEGWVGITDTDEWTDRDTTELLVLIDAGLPTSVGPVAPAAAAVEPRTTASAVVVDYQLVTRQRVAAGTGASIGNERSVHRVIPGATVRGALAAAWMREHGLSSADQRMADLFERDLVVRQAIPRGAEFVPVSRQWCKYPEGDQHGPGGSHAGHVDMAEAYLRTGAEPKAEFCGGHENGKGWKTDDVAANLTGHTQLTLDEVADVGNLYSVEAVDRRVVLSGSLIVHDAGAVDWLEQARTLRVGGRRSTLGQVEWTARRGEVLQPNPSEPAEVSTRLLLRCRSPLIAVDEFGAPTTDIGHVLRRRFPRSKPVVERSWVRTAVIGGWHMASNLPKPDDLAVDAGSVFVINGLPATAGTDLAGGLGLRRLEGFGEVEVISAGDELPAIRSVLRPDDDGTVTGPNAAAVSGSTSAEADPVSADADGGADASPSVTPDPLRRLADRVPENRKDAVRNGLLDALRKIAGFQSSGMDGVAKGVAKATTRQPWARDLPGPALDALVELLDTADAGQVRDRIQGGEWT